MSTTTASPDSLTKASGTPPTVASEPTLAAMAAQTKADRNRAIDVYRVVAMLAVAFGHWVAMVAIMDNGRLVGGNALEFVPSMAWVTWLLQVMPLFFVVGGYSSAMSLDSAARPAGADDSYRLGLQPPRADYRPQDWIAARLRRMLPPAVALAGTWLVLISLGAAFGQLDLVAAGAFAAAVPLWFLANYTIDTALAPFVLPRLRRRPRMVAATIVGAFLAFEAFRIAGIGHLAAANWVIGWLSFQVLGMAWRDGLLPTGRRLLVLAGLCWAGAIAIVTSGGPWSVSMVGFDGIAHAPTNPPNLALLVFGAAYSLTAIAAAPAVSRFVAARPTVWTGVIAANTVAMSIYLWHMTAAIAVTAVLHLTVGLPETSVASVTWWLWKVPTIVGSMLVLAPIVFLVSGIERKAMLAPRRPWNGGVASIFGVAIVASAALKWWTVDRLEVMVPCLVVLVLLGRTVLRPTEAPTPTPAST
ncbi:MAG: acyltransferase [Actinomycetota bacterium]